DYYCQLWDDSSDYWVF
nr:immunoglobulin light chain junction region [Macaca mulatta]MOX70013.1 immunoglobulin light chain junction region [Macaca mulatta]MOX70729.1 immunoglobulin light chain junction region [Macaca mulatta]MOX70978.1 immunoglobulin light chain junction region [Macaca mulatta]MOX72297.1 immunoglobulin light chain junction region [Macaca mulatta]